MTGTCAQVEDGKGGAAGRGTSVTGSHEELLMATHKGREAQKSVGGRQVGDLSRWMVALRLGGLGGRSGCKERAKRR